jgi:hypothetical protein
MDNRRSIIETGIADIRKSDNQCHAIAFLNDPFNRLLIVS